MQKGLGERIFQNPQFGGLYRTVPCIGVVQIHNLYETPLYGTERQILDGHIRSAVPKNTARYLRLSPIGGVVRHIDSVVLQFVAAVVRIAEIADAAYRMHGIQLQHHDNRKRRKLRGIQRPPCDGFIIKGRPQWIGILLIANRQNFIGFGANFRHLREEAFRYVSDSQDGQADRPNP